MVCCVLLGGLFVFYIIGMTAREAIRSNSLTTSRPPSFDPGGVSRKLQRREQFLESAERFVVGLVAQEMALGAGGEKIGNLPAVQFNFSRSKPEGFFLT